MSKDTVWRAFRDFILGRSFILGFSLTSCMKPLEQGRTEVQISPFAQFCGVREDFCVFLYILLFRDFRERLFVAITTYVQEPTSPVIGIYQMFP